MVNNISILSACIKPSCAYLDPGTGSMLVSFLMGLLATLIYSFKGFFYKIQAFILGKSLDKDLRKLNGIDILFYSEGGNYWNVFSPVIKSLDDKGVKCAYYTSSENDIGLNSNFKYLTSKFIGNGITAYSLLNQIEFKIVVMTTPQLDVMELRKTRKVGHYVHLVHSPTGILLYRKFALDYFDYVMCSGPHQIIDIRELERVRKLPPKLLLETGLTYYDVMLSKIKNDTEDKNKTILVAPTWGRNGILTKIGVEPIEKLLRANYQVILRPHPQSYISEKKIMDKVEAQLAKYSNLTIDKNPSGEEAMKKASLMISDVSGIVFDFTFIYEKPVVVIKNEVIREGFEAQDVKLDIWESKVLSSVATILNHSEIENLLDVIDKEIVRGVNPAMFEVRDKSVFNLGQAGEIASNQLIDLVREI